MTDSDSKPTYKVGMNGSAFLALLDTAVLDQSTKKYYRFKTGIKRVEQFQTAGRKIETTPAMLCFKIGKVRIYFVRILPVCYI